jgi:GLPGLI family protein
MQKVLLVAMVFLLAQTVLGQTTEGKIIYERKMNMYKRLPPENENMKAMIPEFTTIKTQLLYSGDESVYKDLPEENDIREHAGEDGNRLVFRMGNGDNETYRNYVSQKSVEQKELGPKKYIIEDTLRKLAWKLSDDTMKATATTRQGDNVIAWYTEDIPAPFGPEQFGGLPGLVLKVDLADGWVVFTAEDIQPTVDKKMVKMPTNGKKISKQEFQKMMDEAFGPSNGAPRIRIITSESHQ